MTVFLFTVKVKNEIKCVFFQQKKAVKAEDDTFSDDEVPVDVDFQDPYFAEELSKQRKQVNGMIQL